MRGERLHPVERRGLRNDRLQREPLVDDQRIAAIAGVEIVERGRAFGHVTERERRQRRHAVGHVVGDLVLPRRKRDRVGPTRRDQKIEAGVAQRAPRRRWRRRAGRVRSPRAGDSGRTARPRDARRSSRATRRAPRRWRRDRRRGRSRARCRPRPAASAPAPRRRARACRRPAMAASASSRPASLRAAPPARNAATLSTSRRGGERLHRLPAIERIASRARRGTADRRRRDWRRA